ncbi:YbaK/prolyl-tRNA synthetase associated region [Candidatus Moduliflexus flocculans]|uniref:YbaK/prolyl-tRNA synthetase associated region n=1 Tax=Candidatus Moduliflexus flocculans TaxID=1499966 RepID=A0A0S6VPV1_9BACT|nr:YbaK/prolyl-tRNA synthetase associated region [Candidatus Moduliflexus flocculans]
MNVSDGFFIMAYQRILDLLKQQGIEFILHEHDAVRTIDDANERAAHLVERLIKTIVFKVKDDGWILAGIPAHGRIDYRKLAAALGVNRRQLRSVSPEEIERELGFQIGGVGPIPVQADVRAIFDASLLAIEFARCGSGKNTETLELRFSDLLRVTHGETHEILQAE